MSLTQIRSRIQALQRRYALPLAVIRLRPYATQFCHQWATAQDQQQPLPETPAFIRKLADAGFRLTTFMYLHHHIERHLSNNTCPNPKGIISALLPHAAAREGIIDAIFHWDHAPQECGPATTPNAPMLCFSKPFRSTQCAHATGPTL